MIWFLLFLAVALGATAPFIAERYRVAMSDGRRGSAPGQFAELSQGVTHYHLMGPIDGPLVICIHGLTTPSFVWDDIGKALADSGFRVLVYDLYGRGYSDRPMGLQNKQFFNQQLDDLLTHLGIEGPAHVIGYSMGGAIAAGFAAAYPARVRRLILLASAGMTLNQTPLLRIIRERGIIGQWLMLAAYPAQFRRGIKAEREAATAPKTITEGQENQLMYQGFIPSVLSSLRGILSRPLEGEHLSLRQLGLPIMAIWGSDDDVIRASAMGQLAAWNRDVIHEVVEDAGHGLPYTHPDQVIDHIAGFLPPPAGDDWGHDT
ncbi:alpha/beta hydrolase [uncultured Sulfitobacter sp.]|uniref:alpha/beta fold hydrolase n=1 Tax=uncultured Sulfitobacter sp. TaxID=191468 RepID=UPI00261FF768|nr:alpha/beta hydrolase [uncultured Sulfitobacter sp.]